MLIPRRFWVTEVGSSADEMYRDLVNHFIEEDILKWQSIDDGS